MNPLFKINNLEKGVFLNRPSKLNKSPFVGDVLVNDEEKDNSCTKLRFGGKCIENTEVYMKKSKNSGKKENTVHLVVIIFVILLLLMKRK